jgi:hypothetical protein
MFVYLIKMIVCSGVFYALYATLFNKEKMLVFNRVYLLSSLVASFLIPLITITVEVPVVAQQLYVAPGYSEEMQPLPPSGVEWIAYINAGAIILALIISGYLLLRFLINILNLKAKGKSGVHFYRNGVRVVLLNGPIAPHSFLNTIYFSKTEYDTGKIEAEVMAHELAHIRQKHSWDILFLELLKIITWFNPFIYWYKRSVMINHELLADAAVIKQLGDVRSYQVVLLQRAAMQSSLALASSFTFYITKKRLTMLLKKPDKKRTILMSLALIPVTALVVFVGCNTVEKKDTNLNADREKQLAEVKDDALSTISKDTTVSLSIPPGQSAADSGKAAGLTEPEIEVKKFSPPKVVKDMPEGPGASANELAMYEEVIKQMRNGGKNKYKWIDGKSDKLFPVYKKMTLQQRQKASPLPPPPPPTIEMKKFPPPKIEENKETSGLINKLPGIKVDGNGNMTMNSMAVKKVLLDGKEFTGIGRSAEVHNIIHDASQGGER